MLEERGEGKLSSVRVDDQIEYIFGSKGRVRVLSALSEVGEMNINKLITLTGLSYSSVNKHVKTLTKMRLVEDGRYGRLRLIRPCFSRLRIVFEAGNPVKVEITNQ